jgi:7,8-dihydropterin-6-yl-methyl-4-(beta-D-ribofuranosyl)aminobenzene 5'-phosphate synthase
MGLAGTLVGADTSQVQTAMTEVDRLTIWVITDNYYDGLRPENSITKRYRGLPGRSFHAEHGLSYYVETSINGETNGCMFDYGQDPSGVMNNIALLGLDPGKASAFALSHGHYDHYMGAAGIFEHNQSRIKRNTPFYVGEEAFNRRYSLRPGAAEAVDLGQLKKEDIERFGLEVIEIKKPTEVMPGAYFTGNIERVTDYERVPPGLLIKRDEKTEPDDFRGEQALVFKVKGQGLVVLSSCAHAGIVNTVKQAQKMAGSERIHAILGGFHLINAKAEIIRRTIDDLKALEPDFVVPAHCTGFEALVQFMREMPDQFILNTVGTRYTFTA